MHTFLYFVPVGNGVARTPQFFQDGEIGGSFAQGIQGRELIARNIQLNEFRKGVFDQSARVRQAIVRQVQFFQGRTHGGKLLRRQFRETIRLNIQSPEAM